MKRAAMLRDCARVREGMLADEAEIQRFRPCDRAKVLAAIARLDGATEVFEHVARGEFNAPDLVNALEHLAKDVGTILDARIASGPPLTKTEVAAVERSVRRIRRMERRGPA